MPDKRRLEWIGDADDTGLPPGIGSGTMLTPAIRLFRPIAVGGMGSVWLAEHLGIGAPVAVKFLHPSIASHPAAIARFRREAAAAARIRSQHVVQIFDCAVSDGGLLYMVMELLEGETLEELLGRGGRVSLEETSRIVRQVSHVLAKAHDAGIIHRDVKPENLVLVEGEEHPFVKLIDFGIARFVGDDESRLTSAGQVVGTPQYMSPEQIEGVDATAANDLWSLAVVAYACLTGALPFDGNDLVGMAVALKRGAFVPPSTLARGVPRALDAWFARAFDPVPARRFESARSMWLAFEEALARPARQVSRDLGSDPEIELNRDDSVPELPPYLSQGAPAPTGSHEKGARRGHPVLKGLSAAVLCLVAAGIATGVSREQAHHMTDRVASTVMGFFQ